MRGKMAAVKHVNINEDKTSFKTILFTRRGNKTTARVAVKTTEDLGLRLIRSIRVRTTEDLGLRLIRSIPVRTTEDLGARRRRSIPET